MCWYETRDVECAQAGCHTIVDTGGYSKPIKCPHVRKNKHLSFGECNKTPEQRPRGHKKGKRKICDSCKQKTQQKQKWYYKNAGKHITTHGKTQQGKRSGTPMPEEEEQSGPVHDAGVGSSTGQGGHDLGASGVNLDAGSPVSAMPEELDLEEAEREVDDEAHDQ